VRGAREWDDYYATNDDPWRRPDDDLVTEVASLPAGRALDLGAGEGADSLWLACRGWEVTAVDQSAAAIGTLLRLAVNEGLTVRVEIADVAEYRSDAAYDLVLICHMHLPGELRSRILANAAAALAPGGLLLLIGIAAADARDGAAGSGALLAMPDEVLGALPELSIERCEVRCRTIRCLENDLPSDVMLVSARRPISDDAEHPGRSD